MRVHRSTPFRLEVMEKKVLLSSGIGYPAAVQIEAQKALKPFIFNGKLPLKLTATFDEALGENTYTEVTLGFREKKPFAPMGNRVKVSGALAHPGVASSDGLPNLADSTFQLSNAKGSLLVTFSSSTANAYRFMISGATKQFVRADGTTGTAVFGVAPKTGFALTFKTTGHGSQSSSPPISGTLVTLASFNGTASGTDGGYPNAGVALDSQGNLFGTTESGGTTGDGTVFEIAKGSSSPTTIASFDSANGANPVTGVTLDAQGNLYGTTLYGGAGQVGTVWEIAKGTDTIATLGSFDGTDGSRPRGGVVVDAQGNLYGTTSAGGSSDSGTVWEIVNGSNTITTLTSLSGTNGSPVGGVALDAQGDLYGSGYESVWELAKGSNTVTAILPHYSADFLTLDAQGNLYGTAYSGATHGSFAWELNRLANGTDSFTILGTETGSSSLGAGVTLDAQGNFYGTSPEGGAYGDGMLWEIVRGSNTVTTLVSFNGSNRSPSLGGLAVDGEGNIFGTTALGGSYGFGTVWEFIISS
jgi:uncharacterized repeat protein (TIGR03803 family)